MKREWKKKKKKKLLTLAGKSSVDWSLVSGSLPWQPQFKCTYREEIRRLRIPHFTKPDDDKRADLPLLNVATQQRALVWRWAPIVDESFLSVSSNSACLCEIAFWAWAAFTQLFFFFFFYLIPKSISKWHFSRVPAGKLYTKVFYGLFIHLIWTAERVGHTLVFRSTHYIKRRLEFLAALC